MGRKEIYVYTPPYYKTGGTELCHQLVYQINQLGGKAYVAYEFATDGNYLNPAFEKYVDEYVIVDNELCERNDIIVVIPETASLAINRFVNAEIYMWWMSVDNYYYSQNLALLYKEKGFLRTIKHLITRSTIKRKYLPIHKMTNVKKHLAQSEYAMDFLRSKGINNVSYLSDYINEDYIKKSEDLKNIEKDDYIVYNPKKGWFFTKKIIRRVSDIKFIALKDMSNTEIMECLSRAKLYIDFGAHPGKDRLPREAALMGCCIITGRRGSAAYDDVDIPQEYKIKDSWINLKKITFLIRRIIRNYDNEINEFENYVCKIKNEYNVFEKNVREIFIE